jgi:methionine-rich copper-binding protein CopC
VIVAANENIVSYRELTRLSRNVDVTLPVSKAEAPIGVEVPLLTSYSCAAGKVGLYRATAAGPRWLGSATLTDTHAAGKIDVSGSVFVAADEVAPAITGNAETERGGWLRVKVTDHGSGLDENSFKAFYGNTSLPVKFSNGEVWVHAASVADGEHEIIVEAADNAGNRTQASVRGLVVGATSLMQISTYPNPARNYANIRVKFSGPAAATAEASVKIYDTAGHKVTEMPLANLGSGDYEARWNLVDEDGKAVANGLYLAEIKASLSGASTKERRKIAVLR